jgi:radical SAM-linked protein
LSVNTLKIGFEITHQLRYLSHRQIVKFFQRAFIRAGIDICFSEGFNPRPKMSLPLPRSVGIITKDDLLTIQVPSAGAKTADDYFAMLALQMPMGCSLTDAQLFNERVSFAPTKAEYSFKMNADSVEKVHTAVGNFLGLKLSGQPIFIERKSDEGKVRKIDAAFLIDDVKIQDQAVIVTSLISNEAALRVEELLNLLNIDHCDLTAPVERANVQWNKK